jgi:membrane-bound lytic murein transglycosylase MltF
MNQYMKRVKELKDPTISADWERFQQTLKLFEKYGPRYGFDPLMLAAQGYQESQLNQSARSHVGAIGVMQLMPQTGQQMKVGDIRITEANVHAGAKYIDMLMSSYFSDAKFTEGNRPLFAFASYNAGPGNIAKMRKEAVQRGLDPDKWFNNVEIVVGDRIGTETTTYVRNNLQVLRRLSLDAGRPGGGAAGPPAGRARNPLKPVPSSLAERRGCPRRAAAWCAVDCRR